MANPYTDQIMAAEAQRQIESGSLGSAVRGATDTANILKDRWWKKEAEEFIEAEGNAFKETMYKIGELGADETSQDIEGMWSTYQGAVTTFLQKASTYRSNPYISDFAEKMIGQQKKMFTELTGGISAQAAETSAQAAETSAQAQAQRAEQEGELIEPRKKLLAAQTKKAEADAAKGLGVKDPVDTMFGKGTAKVIRETHPTMLMDYLKIQKPFQAMLDQKKRELGTAKWDTLSDEQKKSVAGPAGVNMTDAELMEEFIEAYPLNAEENRDVERKAAILAITQSYGPNTPIHALEAMVEMAQGPKLKAMDEERKKVPKIDRTVMLNSHSPEMNTLLLGTKAPGLTGGADVTDEPPTPGKLLDKRTGAPNSPLGQVVGEYLNKRRAGTPHEVAVTQIFRSAKGDSLVDKLVRQRFTDMDIGDPVQDKNISNFRSTLLDLLEDYETYYEGSVLEQRAHLEGISVLPEQAWHWTKKIPGIGHILRATTEVSPPKTLAEEGLRTGKKRLTKHSLMKPTIRGPIETLAKEEVKWAAREGAQSARAKDIRSRAGLAETQSPKARSLR